MLRLIHTADWQLGKPYGRFDSDVFLDWVGEMGQPKDASRHGTARTALAALPLAEMAERMQETAHRARPGAAPIADADDTEPVATAGVLHLF